MRGRVPFGEAIRQGSLWPKRALGKAEKTSLLALGSFRG